MGMKEIVLAIMSSARTGVEDANLSNKQEITTYAISSESLDSSSREIAKTAMDALGSTVEDTLQMVLGAEGIDAGNFTSAQFAAAKSIAALAINPKEYLAAMGNLRKVSVSGHSQNISVESLNTDEVIDVTTLSTEGFDGQAISNALFFSIAYNFGAARQDAFGEAFFPTIVIDPTVSGFNIETEFTSLMTEFDRSITGTPDVKKFNRVPIVKAIYENDLFTNDKNKVIPVLRDENSSYFLAGHEYIDKSSGIEIRTAPLLFGKKLSLLGISQTDTQLSKGSMDNNDALDRTLNLDKIYYKLTGKDSGNNDVTEVMSVNVAIFPHSNFTYATQDHNKDLSLAFDTESIIINTSTTKTAKAAASVIFAELPQDHSIRLHLRVDGSANTKHGDIEVYASAIEVSEIFDAAGNLLASTSADYLAIASVFENIKLAGYTIEAYTTNSNHRTRGQLITSDRYNQIYTVPLRSGITVMAPINNMSGTDNDASKITSQIQAAGIKTSIYAVKTLTDYADMLNNITNNGANTNVDLIGIGRHHVDPYYNETSIDLSSLVDSVKSSERIEDIRAALINKITEEVLSMFVYSNYCVAHKTLHGNVGGRVSVVIGTDPKIKLYLTGGASKINLGDEFEAHIVSTPNKKIKNKIFITFSIFDEQRNTVPNPLSYGCMAWAPTITTDVVRNQGGSIVRELHNIPRFLHVVNLPIMSVMHVSEFAGVLSKVSALRSNI